MLARVVLFASLLLLAFAAVAQPAAAIQGEVCVKGAFHHDCPDDALVCVGYPIGCNIVYVQDPTG